MKLTEKIAAFLLRIFQMPRNRATQKFVNDFMQQLRFIEIVTGGFQIKDSGKNVLAEIKWYMVKDAELFDDRLVLYFLNNQPSLTVPEKYHQNWHQLIQEIPKGYPTYNYDAVKSFFENLQGCDICGLIAVQNGECLACGNAAWNIELEQDYESKEVYVWEMQFDQFEPVGEGEKIKISNDPAFGFQSYRNWVPLVKEDDFRK